MSDSHRYIRKVTTEGNWQWEVVGKWEGLWGGCVSLKYKQKILRKCIQDALWMRTGTSRNMNGRMSENVGSLESGSLGLLCKKSEKEELRGRNGIDIKKNNEELN